MERVRGQNEEGRGVTERKKKVAAFLGTNRLLKQLDYHPGQIDQKLKLWIYSTAWKLLLRQCDLPNIVVFCKAARGASGDADRLRKTGR